MVLGNTLGFSCYPKAADIIPIPEELEDSFRRAYCDWEENSLFSCEKRECDSC